MTVYASLLSQVPIPQKQWQTKTDTPTVASIVVGDIDKTTTNTTPKISFIEKIKQKILEKRLAKLESIPENKRTPAQQAELDANKKAFNYMI